MRQIAALGAYMYPDDFEKYLIKSIEELEAHPERVRVACCIFMLEAQVNNGGFHQYLGNSTGQFANETLVALENISAFVTKSFLESAIAVCYKNGYPIDPKEHSKNLRNDDNVHEEIEDINCQFYKYEDDLSALVNEYMR